MTDEFSSRRRFLTGVSGVGIAALAGCMGSDGVSGYEFRELADVHEISGTYHVILSENVVNSDALALEPRQQIRVGRGHMTADGEPENSSTDTVRPHNPTIVTLRETRPIDVADHEVVVSSETLDVMDSAEGDRASFVNYAPHPDITTRSDAKDNNEYIEEVIDDGTDNRRREGGVCFIAPHGGQIYSHTARQANRAATRMGESAWVTRAFEESQRHLHRRWHVPATAIHPNSYPKLNELGTGFDYAVSFSGFDSSPDILSGEGVTVGGLASEDDLKKVKVAIQNAFHENNVSASVRMHSTGAPENPSSDHIVNWLTESDRNGIEVAATDSLRQENWEVIADGVEQGVQEILANDE